MRLTKPGQYRDDTYLDGYSDTIHSVMQLRYAKKDGYNPIWSRDGVTFCRKDNGQCCVAINDIPFSFEDLDILAPALGFYEVQEQAELRKWQRRLKKASQEDVEQIDDYIQFYDGRIKRINALRKQICQMKTLI